MIFVALFLILVGLVGLVGIALIVIGAGHHRELERYRSKRDAPATLEGGSSHLSPRSYGGSE